MRFRDLRNITDVIFHCTDARRLEKNKNGGKVWYRFPKTIRAVPLERQTVGSKDQGQPIEFREGRFLYRRQGLNDCIFVVRCGDRDFTVSIVFTKKTTGKPKLEKLESV
ncbi:MAG: hypothetical protein AAB505_00875 [Patescibacteria group bacterium]